MTTREQVWLEAWKAAMGNANLHITEHDLNDIADSCLKAFDERFPQLKPHACPRCQGVMRIFGEGYRCEQCMLEHYP